MWHFPFFITGVVEMNEAGEENSSTTSTIKVAWWDVLGTVKVLSQQSLFCWNLRGVCWGRDALMMLSAYQLPHHVPQPDASGTAFFLQLPVPINLLILEKTETKNWEFVACVIRAGK